MVSRELHPAPGIQLVEQHPGVRALALTTLFAALTALGAQVCLRLPFTPVPVTLQVFFVLMSGVALGSRLGALSQIQYLALGAAGLPVFAGGGAGPAAFLGASGGYLPGFVAAAWVVGWLTEHRRRPSSAATFAAMLAGLAALYLPGMLWLSLWLHASRGEIWGAGLLRAAALGVAPFLAVDLVKAVVAAGIGARLMRT